MALVLPTRTAASVLRLIRIENCVAIALTTTLGGYLAAGASAVTSWSAGLVTARAALVAVLLIAAGNVVNDRLDAGVDAAARPNRPIPSGAVSVPAADRIFGGCTLAALLIAGSLAWWSVAVAASVTAVSLAYSWRLKSTVVLGNVVVGALTGSTVLFGAAVHAGLPVRGWVAAVAITVLMVSFEILKCAEDHQTDTQYRIRTVSTVFGRPVALMAGCLLLAPSLALVVLPGLVLKTHPVQLPLALAVLSLVVGGLLQLPKLGAGNAAITACLHWIKVSWFVGVLALAALRP